MRLTCNELRHAVTTQIDTLALRVDEATASNSTDCKPTPPEAMAKFHRQLPVASSLYVHITQSPAQSHSFLAAYIGASQGSSMPAIKHCTVTIAPGCQVTIKPFSRLLLAMPALETLSIVCQGPNQKPWPRIQPASSAQLFQALAGCKHLHMLALDKGLVASALPAGLGSLTQLHTLSLDFKVHCNNLAGLSSLPHLQCLGVQCLCSPDRNTKKPALLSSIRTLRAASGMHGDDVSVWGPSMQNSIQIGALSMFPGLGQLQGLNLTTGDTSSTEGAYAKPADVLATVQRFAHSAVHWALECDMQNFLAVNESKYLPPGSMPGLRNAKLAYLGLSGPFRLSLNGLIAAAPQLEGLSLSLDGDTTESTISLLQPLEHAVCLHTLWVEYDDCCYNKVCEAAIRYLTQAAAVGRARCPSLQRLYVRRPGAEDWAACAKLPIVHINSTSYLP